MNSYNSPSTKPLFKGTQIVWYITSLLEVLLALRFIIKFLGANSEAGFTNFIYTLTWPFVAPFFIVFPMTTVQNNINNIFEWTTLLAMAVYWMIALAIVRLFLVSKTVSTEEAAAHFEKQEL
jgi:hypothetical protein